MPPQEKFNKKSPVFPAQNKILLKATRILAYSVGERAQDYAHGILSESRGYHECFLPRGTSITRCLDVAKFTYPPTLSHPV
jgi:hypothetical protein